MHSWIHTVLLYGRLGTKISWQPLLVIYVFPSESIEKEGHNHLSGLDEAVLKMLQTAFYHHQRGWEHPRITHLRSGRGRGHEVLFRSALPIPPVAMPN